MRKITSIQPKTGCEITDVENMICELTVNLNEELGLEKAYNIAFYFYEKAASNLSKEENEKSLMILGYLRCLCDLQKEYPETFSEMALEINAYRNEFLQEQNNNSFP